MLIRSLASEGRLAPAAYAASSAAAYSAYPGRLNSLSKRFLERWAAGERWPSCGVAGDTQAHSLVRVPAVVARYAAVGAAELREQVADAVRVHQADQAAADYAGALALLLQRIVRGASAADALKWAAFAPEDSCPMYDDNRKEVATALAEIDGDPRAVAARFGLSCSLPGPWLGGLAIVFANGGDFKRSVRANIWAGGDSCSRAAVVGSLAGAAAGTAGLPADWIARVDDWAELEKAADKIVGDANYV